MRISIDNSYAIRVIKDITKKQNPNRPFCEWLMVYKHKRAIAGAHIRCVFLEKTLKFSDGFTYLVK